MNEVPRSISSAQPFKFYYSVYREKGWLGTVPIPYRRKSTPPENFTGVKPNSKLYPEQSDIDQWLQEKRWYKANIALRLGQQYLVNGVMCEVIGIDVDNYGTKRGGKQLENLERKFGKLPDTWTSTSRNDGISGIRFYLVPVGKAYRGKADTCIEIIQRRNRYAVVYPSAHPDTGSQYCWYAPGATPDGQNFSVDVPNPYTLPRLPDKWFKFLTRGYLDDPGELPIDMDINDNDLNDWAIENFVEPEKMCSYMTQRLAQRKDELDDREDNHDPLVSTHWELYCLGAEGHTGWSTAIKEYSDYWIDDVSKKNKRTNLEAQHEIARSKIGALRKLKGRCNEGLQLVGNDPCEFTNTLGTPENNWLPPQGTTVNSPNKPSALAGWLLERWAAQSRPLIVRFQEFYQYNGVFWNHMSVDDINNELYAVFDRCVFIKITGQNAGSPIPFDPDDAKLRKIIHALMHKAPNYPNLVENSWFNGKRELVLPLQNGLVRVSDGELLPHTSDYFCTYALHASFDPDATCPKTDAFIKHLANGDGQAGWLLYEWMGYVIGGSNKYQKGLILKGKSGCGKGVFARLMNQIITNENFGAYKVEDYKRNTFSKEPLLGKSLVVFSDNRVDFTHKTFVDLVLEVIGQDSTSLRLPYMRRSINVYLPCRFMILTNQMPSVADDSGAFVRRFVALDCKSEVEKVIDDYELELVKELPGIVNRMLRGLQRLENRHCFVQPEQSSWVLRAMRETSSAEVEYVRSQCEIGPNYVVDREVLYEDYKAHCYSNGEKQLNKKQFSEALIAMGGIELHKRGTRTEGQRWVFTGLRRQEKHIEAQ